MRQSILKNIAGMVILGLALIFMIPMSADAATLSSGDWEYELIDHKEATSSYKVAKLTAYTGKSTSITIPSTIGGYKVEEIDIADNIGYDENGGDPKYIKSVTLAAGFKTVPEHAFWCWSNLEKVSLPAGVTGIGGWAFDCCYGLTDITLPSGLKSIGDYAFSDCSGLTNVTLPSGLVSMGINAFSGCVKLSLSSASLPKGLVNIGYGAFEGCGGLTSIVLPAGLTYINSYAFRDCGKLAIVSIPESVKTIGDGAFQYCYALKDIYYGGSPSEWKKTSIWSDNEMLSAATIHYAKADSVMVTAVKIKKPLSDSIAAGKSVQLKATVSPSGASNKKVTWKSSNTRYATVSSGGKVTTKKAGAGKSVRITATAKDGSGKKATVTIKIKKGVVKKIVLSGKTSVKAGKSVTIKAKVTASKSANKKLQWTSSNTEYATVSSKGKVTAKAAGKGKTVKITAKATDGSGKKATIKIKIK